MAARALVVSFCTLVPAVDALRSIGHMELRRMKESGYEWPSAKVQEPSQIPGLAKGISNNFMQVFFKAHGPLHACAEARHVVDAVMTPYLAFSALLLYAIA